MGERGIAEEESLLRVADFTEASGYAAMRSILEGGGRPDAVFAGNDAIAYGAIQGILDSGLRIPDDVSIAGFDDDFPSRFLQPALTSMTLPAASLGQKAASTVIDILDGIYSSSGEDHPPGQIVDQGFLQEGRWARHRPPGSRARPKGLRTMPKMLISTHLDPSRLVLEETLYHCANGYIGVRGCFEEAYPEGIRSVRGSYVNAFYDTHPINHPEKLYGFPETGERMLNVTDAQTIELTVDGESVRLEPGRFDRYERSLDSSLGISRRGFEWSSTRGSRVAVEIRRLASLARPELFAVGYALRAPDRAVDIVVTSRLEGKVENHYDESDPRLSGGAFKSLAVVAVEAEATAAGGGLYVESRTLAREASLGVLSLISIETGPAFRAEATRTATSASLAVAFRLDPGQGFAMTRKNIYVDSDRKGDVREAAAASARSMVGLGFAALAAEQEPPFPGAGRPPTPRRKATRKCRRRCASTYSSSCNPPPPTSARAFPPRASRERDTRATISGTPRFTWRRSIVTRIPRPRGGCSSTATRLSLGPGNTRASWGREGARSSLAHHRRPGMLGLLSLGQRPVPHQRRRSLFLLEVLRSHRGSGLPPGFRGGAAFRDREARVELGHKADGEFRIDAVTGPDEYACIVDNNYYTNAMARFNLLKALEARAILARRFPDALSAIDRRIGMEDGEEAGWEEAADLMYLPYDAARDITPQDDGFLRRGEWDFEGTPAADYPLLLSHHHLSLRRRQVCKQADAVLAHFLLPGAAAESTVRNSYAYYEKITTHDSSLSYAVFAAMAARLETRRRPIGTSRGRLASTWTTRKAIRRTASMRRTWGGPGSLIALGFGGLATDGGRPSFRPVLPELWRSLRFTITFRGSTIRLKAARGSGGRVDTSLALASGPGLEVEIYGERRFLGKSLSVAG